MCGVSGYFGAQRLEQNRLFDALHTLKHRGPDDAGIYQHAHRKHCVGFAHRRLSILDLDNRSAQPFRLGCQVLIFNGEIYNYLEIRKELEYLGHCFQTQGDTEVLAYSLKEWGEHALDRLEGMWSFAWYDEESGRLLLARDRFGEKPLYLWKYKRNLLFASEIKGLAALAGQWPDINENHMLRYLVNGYKSLYKTTETFHKSVFVLPAGNLMWLDPDHQPYMKSYWKPEYRKRAEWTFADSVEATREKLIDAMRLRLRSDVPIAFCLSGGIDSNSLISIASKQLGQEVHGFTVVNTDARYKEDKMVDLAVKKLDIRHTSVPLQKRGFLTNLENLVLAHDSPVSTISSYLNWQLMKAVHSEGYKVTISGIGADELFTGYYDHHNLYLYEVAQDAELFQQSLASWLQHLAPIVRNPHLRDPKLYLKDPKFRSHIYFNSNRFADYLTKPWRENFTEVDYGCSLLRNRMLNEVFTETVPVLLHEEDINAMSCSIENRSPFLDRTLFETAFSIPTHHLVQDGKAKAVLREAMRGLVPDKILDNRRKVGFNAPITDLLDVSDPETKARLLDGNLVFDFVQHSKVKELLSKANLENSESKFIFNVLNIELFLTSVRG